MNNLDNIALMQLGLNTNETLMNWDELGLNTSDTLMNWDTDIPIQSRNSKMETELQTCDTLNNREAETHNNSSMTIKKGPESPINNDAVKETKGYDDNPTDINIAIFNPQANKLIFCTMRQDSFDSLKTQQSVVSVQNNDTNVSVEGNEKNSAISIFSKKSVPNKPPPADVKPFSCDECTKSFLRPHQLKRHKKVHSGVKPFKCDKCENSFLRSWQLQVHKFNHSRHQPFHCDTCGKPFSRLYSLNRHKMLVHSGIKPS